MNLLALNRIFFLILSCKCLVLYHKPGIQYWIDCFNKFHQLAVHTDMNLNFEIMNVNLMYQKLNLPESKEDIFY